MLIYDGDCAFCQRCIEIGVNVLSNRFHAEPYQSLGLGAFGLTAGGQVRLCGLAQPSRPLSGRPQMSAAAALEASAGRRASHWPSGH